MARDLDGVLRKLRALAVAGDRRLRGVRHRGHDVECPCCRRTYSSFLSTGVRRRSNALCPGCGSLERHRLLWLYLQRHTDLLGGPRRRLLHVAPEPTLRSLLRRLPSVDYRGVDLRSPYADDHADLTALPYEDASFDVILCSHVLEHVDRDRVAMAELRRVLALDGWAIIQVPVAYDLEHTIDEKVDDPAERERRYGNRDHVRQYGCDYVDRLAAAGFSVDVDEFAYTLSDEEKRRFGLGLLERVHLCRPAEQVVPVGDAEPPGDDA